MSNQVTVTDSRKNTPLLTNLTIQFCSIFVSTTVNNFAIVRAGDAIKNKIDFIMGIS